MQNRAVGYQQIVRLRTALERRGYYLAAESLVDGVLYSSSPEQAKVIVERVRLQHSIPRDEIYDEG